VINTTLKQIGLIFGPNGVGKGTLANHIEEQFNYIHINMGNLIREWIVETNNHTYQHIIDNGEMVEDTIVKQILSNKFKELSHSSSPVIMEGIPRRHSQVAILKEISETYKFQISYIIVLNAPLKEILHRVEHRVMAPDGNVYHLELNPPPAHFSPDQLVKRLDDRPEIVTKRYENYMVNTLECLSDTFFKDVPTLNIDGTQSIPAVYAQAEEFLQTLQDHKLISI